jgi:hypothetical protein
MSVTGRTSPISVAMWSAWALPTPARCSTRANPSPRPSVARRSIIGRSGDCVSGVTASLGAIRRPVSAPKASGAIARARASSYCASESGVADAPGSGVMAGPSDQAA